MGTATFGPALTSTGVTGDVVLVNDGVGSSSNGCETLVNASSVNGKIALVHRGTCGFTVKVKNAQNAGAIAVIVADSLPGCPPQAMGGTDATITIPSVRVMQDDGNLLETALAAGLNVTLRRDPALSQGADPANQVRMYTPTAFAGGSSVSHWDVTPDPDLLMEPSLMGSLSSNVDLTRWFFTDLGWGGVPSDVTPSPTPSTPPAAIALSAAPNPIRGLGVVRFWLARPEVVTVDLLDASGRQVARLADGAAMGPGLNELPYDPGALQNGIYFLRLRSSSGEGMGKIAILR